MKIKLMVVAFIATWTTTALSQTDSTATDSTKTETKAISVSGSVDAYLRQNITGPNGAGAIAPNTSFANLNGFALGMANVVGSFEGKKAGAVVDLVFGPRGEDAVFLSGALRPAGSSNIVNQLYAYWNVTDKITLTMGNFNTFLGYEVISPAANFHYSTSYMFSYGPFSHTGIKSDFALTNDLSLMLAYLNNTDATEFNPNNTYTLGAQLGYKTTYLNFLYGKQGVGVPVTMQFDLTAGYDLTKKFYLGVNATYNETGASNFYGAAIYPLVSISDAFGLGVRVEYFAESNGGAGAIGVYDANGDANIIAPTLTASYAVGGLTIKPEVRFDLSSEDGFLDNKLSATNQLGSFVLAAVYSF
ncbi:MAG: hypothetical protein ACJAZ2_000463 [Glaciecola sp.]|jgi:hypothetical protein